MYVTKLRNEIEAKKSGALVTSDDTEMDMESDLAGMSEVLNG